jgi:hypothetical protein
MATIAIVRMVLFIENKLAPFLPPLKVLNRSLDSRRSGASRNANSTKGGLKMKRVFVECGFRSIRPGIPEHSGHRFRSIAAGGRSEATLEFFS